MSENSYGDAIAVWSRSNGTNTIIQSSDGLDFFEVIAPQSLSGKLVKNRFLRQMDRVNELKWRASPSVSTAHYYIYRDGHRIGIVPSNRLMYHDHNQKKGAHYIYTITAVNDRGDESTAATVSLP